MSDSLTTYLQDHLAGSLHATELLNALRDQNPGKPLGKFAAELLIEVKADRDVLEDLIQRLGTTPGGMKEWGAWIAEKVSRMKLTYGAGEGLGTYESLEFLMLGIHGKWALWRTLAMVARFDDRLKPNDFAELIAGAQSQHDQVDELRLSFVESSFGVHVGPAK